MEENPIELHSPSVQEILGRVPPRILRYGTWLIVIITLLFITGSWIFRYPDIVSSQIVVTTTNPPAPLIARTNGKIAEIRVTDKTFVKSGEILAVIENPASLKDMETLALLADSVLQNIDNEVIIEIQFPVSLQLGEVQQEYAQFLKALEDYKSFISLKYYSQKVKLLRDESEKYKMYIKQVQKQIGILQREMRLAGRQFSRDSVMFKQGVISPSDFEKAESAYLQKRYALEEAGSQLTKARLQLADAEQQILDLQLQEVKEQSRLKNDLAEEISKLKGAISIWEQTYVIKAPIDGQVSFNKYWSVNQTVSQGDRVITVVPAGPTEIIGKIELPVAKSGKVKPGQKVNIKFDNFPYLEFGMVRGFVHDISLVPANNMYNVEVTLPDSLKTNYNTYLPFSQEMQGIAEIITNDRRLLERIVTPLKSIIRRQRMLSTKR